MRPIAAIIVVMFGVCSITLQHELNRLASSVEINNKRVRKITPQRRVRLNTTYA
jgi:hypothetical protein